MSPPKQVKINCDKAKKSICEMAAGLTTILGNLYQQNDLAKEVKNSATEDSMFSPMTVKPP